MKKILLCVLVAVFYGGTTYSQTYSGQPNVTIQGSHTVNIACGTGSICYPAHATQTADGYTGTYTVDTVPYLSFPSTGTAVSANTDDVWSSVITLPFNFCFFGNTYNQCVIGSNGILSFDISYAGNYCPWPLNGAGTTASPIPNSNLPFNSIMCPYQDIDPAVAGNITYSVQGTAPRRMFIVSFNQVAQYSCTTLNSTSQLVLYESTNIIDVYIANKALCTTWNNGNAIEGIQDATATNAYVVTGRNNVQWTATNDGYRFQPVSGNNISIKWHKAGDTTTISTSDSAQLCPQSNSTSQYIVDVTYKQCDSALKVVSDSILVSVSQSAGLDQYVSCPTYNSTATMAASGTGTWYAVPGNPANVTINSPTSPNTTITGFTTLGTYHFIWTSVICTDTADVIVAARPNAGPDQATCVNGTVTMAATGVGTWAALPGNPGPTTIFSPNSATTAIGGFPVGGTYQYIWYVGTCQDTAVVNVPTFVASASTAATTLCKYQTTTLTATAGPPSLGPFTFNWLPSSGVVSPASASTAITPLLAPTTYTVVVTSANGCVLTETVQIALSGAAPVVHVLPSNNNVCPGDTVTLNSAVFAESLVPCGLTDTLFSNNNTYTGYLANDTNSSTGTTYTTVYGSPFMASYRSYKAQYLFTKAELNAAGLSSGTITDFAFFIKQLNSTVAYDTFAVSMGCTNLDSLTGFVNNLQEVIPPMYGPNAPAANVSLFANSWNPLPLTHFFNWDGASNIVIQICYSIPGTTYNQDDYVSYSNTPYRGSSVVAGQYYFTNQVDGCSLGSSANFYSVLNTRPNILFHVSVPTVLTYQWSPPTLLCDTCSETQVIVTADSTYTLIVNDNGCSNVDSARILINRNIGMRAVPDTTVCGGIDTVRLNTYLTNPPVATCNAAYTVTSIPYTAISGNITTIPANSYVSSAGFTGSTDDGTAGPFNIGFSFPFYCQNYNQFYVNTNGWISFVNPYPATSVGQENTAQTFPPTAGSANPLKEIALMTGNYQLSNGFSGGGTVDYFVSGSAPNRTLVIQFNAIASVSGTATTTGEIHIHETTGYVDILLGSSNYSGVNHTTGIKDSTGLGIAAPGRNNQNYTITTHEAWRFAPSTGSSVQQTHTVWSPATFLSNDTITNPLAFPPATQQYIATNTLTINAFTNPTTCVVRDTVTIRHHQINYALTATPQTICPGDTSQLAFLSPDSIVSYLWSPSFGLSSTSIADPRASVLDTTKFYVTVRDSSGCSVRDSITVNTYPVQHPQIGPGANICYSDSLALSLSGPYSNYLWYYVDTATGSRTLVSSGATDSVYYAHPSGAYVLEVIPTTGSCPYYTNVVNVDSFAHPQLGIDTSGPTGFCVGGNVVLQTQQGLTGILWTPNSYGSQPSIPVVSTGVFSYTARDLHNCLLFSDTIHVNVNQVPQFVYNNYRNPICSADPDTLIATTTPAGSLITWDYNGNTTIGDTIVTTATGTYYLTADLQGCVNNDSLTLTAAPSPVVTLPADYQTCNCNPDSVVTATVTGGTPGYTYLWSDGSIAATTVDTSKNLSTFTVTVTDANHCTAVSNAQHITNICIQASVTITPPSDTIFLHDTATFTAQPVGGTGYTYLWTSDSATIISQNSVITGAIAQAPLADTIHLLVTDVASQCTYSTTSVIHVIEFAGYVMPNAFTPNGDGINDNYYPVLSNGANSTSKIEAFNIYNQWGQLVYNSIAPPGWNGFFGNDAQPIGVYTYFITIAYPDPADPSRVIQKSITGSFTLLR